MTRGLPSSYLSPEGDRSIIICNFEYIKIYREVVENIQFDYRLCTGKILSLCNNSGSLNIVAVMKIVMVHVV